MDEKTLTEWFTHNIDFTAGNTKVITTGNIWTYDDCVLGMEMGGDLIGVGRASIGNPNWPNDVVGKKTKYKPLPPPYSEDHLKNSSLSDVFVYYMRRWGFVKDRNGNVLPFRD